MFADLNLFALFILKPCDLEKCFSLSFTRFLKLQPAKLSGDSLYLLGTLRMVVMEVSMVVVAMSCSCGHSSQEEDQSSHHDDQKMSDKGTRDGGCFIAGQGVASAGKPA